MSAQEQTRLQAMDDRLMEAEGNIEEILKKIEFLTDVWTQYRDALGIAPAEESSVEVPDIYKDAEELGFYEEDKTPEEEPVDGG